MSNPKKSNESSITNVEQGDSRVMNTEQGNDSKKEKSESRGKSREIKRYDDQTINEMKVSELKDALKKLNVVTTGNKNELRIRLRKVLTQQGYSEAATTAGKEVAANDAETDDEEGTSEDDTTSEENAEKSRKKRREAKSSYRSEQVKYAASRNERERRAGTKRMTEKEVRFKEDSETEETLESYTSVERGSSGRLRRRPPDAYRRSRHVRSEFTVKDVEGSLTYFTGDDKLPIEKWIAEFEDASDLLQWNELQMLIYSKRMLKGSAKRFISLEKNVTSWSVLKKKLKKEFKVKLNSALIHSKLYRRKRQPRESNRQYIYDMLEIAEQGYIEEDALIQYIVDRLPDEDNNKTSLYEACTISELKKKLEVYDRLKERT